MPLITYDLMEEIQEREELENINLHRIRNTTRMAIGMLKAQRWNLKRKIERDARRNK